MLQCLLENNVLLVIHFFSNLDGYATSISISIQSIRRWKTMSETVTAEMLHLILFLLQSKCQVCQFLVILIHLNLILIQI